MKIAGILKNFKEKVPMEIFTWEGERQIRMRPTDSIKHYISFLQAGFIAVNSHTRATKAWVGGMKRKADLSQKLEIIRFFNTTMAHVGFYLIRKLFIILLFSLYLLINTNYRKNNEQNRYRKS